MTLEYVAIAMVDFKELNAMAQRLPESYERRRLLMLLDAYNPHRPQPQADPVVGDPKLTIFMFEDIQYVIPTAEGRRVCISERGLIRLPDERLVYPEVFTAPVDQQVFSIVSVKLYTASEDEKDLNPHQQVRAGLRTKPN